MTPLRAKYIRDLTIRGRAQRTQRAYTRYVSELARYYQRSPELISYEEVTNWLYHLIKERQLSASSVNVTVNAVRFLYGITLGRNRSVDEVGPAHEAPYPAPGSLRAQRVGSDFKRAEPAARSGVLDDGLCLRATRLGSKGSENQRH